MGISLSEQTAYFLWSLALGVFLGVLYDAVRAVRMVLKAKRLTVMISDIVFFTICGVITSLFALPLNKGDVRGFVVFGEAAGFLIYRLTIGAVMGKVYAFFARMLRSFVQKIRKILEKIFNYLLKATAFLLYNVGVVIDKSRTKAAEKRKMKRTDAAKKVKRRCRKYCYKGKIYEQKEYKKTAHRGQYGARKKRAGAKNR